MRPRIYHDAPISPCVPHWSPYFLKRERPQSGDFVAFSACFVSWTGVNLVPILGYGTHIILLGAYVLMFPKKWGCFLAGRKCSPVRLFVFWSDGKCGRYLGLTSPPNSPFGSQRPPRLPKRGRRFPAGCFGWSGGYFVGSGVNGPPVFYDKAHISTFGPDRSSCFTKGRNVSRSGGNVFWPDGFFARRGANAVPILA